MFVYRRFAHSRSRFRQDTRNPRKDDTLQVLPNDNLYLSHIAEKR